MPSVVRRPQFRTLTRHGLSQKQKLTRYVHSAAQIAKSLLHNQAARYPAHRTLMPLMRLQGSATRFKALADATHRAVITLDRGACGLLRPRTGSSAPPVPPVPNGDHMLIDHLVYAAQLG